MLVSEGDAKVNHNHVGSPFKQLLPSFPPGLWLGPLAAWFALDLGREVFTGLGSSSFKARMAPDKLA